MKVAQIIKLVILGLYLMGMLLVGILTYAKNEDFQDYVLGGRKLGKWSTALSAQASDMSGWLLVGLPGAAYLSGVEAGWIAIGLAVGTYGELLPKDLEYIQKKQEIHLLFLIILKKDLTIKAEF